MEDRRIFARIDVTFPLRFLDPNSGKEGVADAVDISANGVGFVTRESLTNKAPLEIWLEIPDQHEPLYTRGQVSWIGSAQGSAHTRVGVRLENARLMALARALWSKEEV
jgi:hypothetical protein